jgi:riboflavin biosynthesis pyrimidine reductase
MTVRRLYPEPGSPISAREAYDVRRPQHPDRPWLGICMVASLDGSTVVHGRSQGLSNANDTDILLTLRDLADVIVVGAGTARQERYGPPRKPGQRVGVVTASGGVNASSPLFSSGAGFLIMAEDGPPTPPSIDAVRAGRGNVDLTAALRRLGEVVDEPQYVHAEGGPMLNGALLTAGCVDELDFTVSPLLVGGDGPRLATGATETLTRFTLAHLLVDDESFVFSRWVRRDVAG